MIGICKVPLADLAKGIGISGDFEVRGRLGELRGKVTVKISVTDTSASAGPGAAKAQRDDLEAEKGSYGGNWEKDIIARIARKLGRLSMDVELMFGIFSRGTKSCTREDFKYCCLQRLNLKADISDKELDMFLRTNARLREKTNIEQNDFVEIFSNAIIQARRDHQNQEALDRTLMLTRYDRLNQEQPLAGVGGGTMGGHPAGATLGHQRGGATGGGGPMDFARKGAIAVLVQCILNSSVDEIRNQAVYSQEGVAQDRIPAPKLRKVLQESGGAADFEALKVTGALAADGKTIFTAKFGQLLDEALLDARLQS